MNKKIRILILIVPVLIATAILLSPLPTTPDDDLFFFVAYDHSRVWAWDCTFQIAADGTIDAAEMIVGKGVEYKLVWNKDMDSAEETEITKTESSFISIALLKTFVQTMIDTYPEQAMSLVYTPRPSYLSDPKIPTSDRYFHYDSQADTLTEVRFSSFTREQRCNMVSAGHLEITLDDGSAVFVACSK